MTGTKAAWDDVADSFTELGRGLKVHFHDVVDRSETDRKAVDDALAQLRKTLDRAFTAAGQAARDPGLREDATKVGTAFVDALSTTLTEAGRRLKAKER